MKESNALAQQSSGTIDPLSPFGWTFGRWFDDVLSRRDGGERLVSPALDITEDDHAVTVTTANANTAAHMIRIFHFSMSPSPTDERDRQECRVR